MTCWRVRAGVCLCACVQVRKSHGLGLEEITALAALEPPGSHGVTFLPYLAGERTPNWPQATGAILGGWVRRPACMRRGCEARGKGDEASLPLRCSVPTPRTPAVGCCRPAAGPPAVLFRAAMEGTTFSLLAGMQRMQDMGIAAT